MNASKLLVTSVAALSVAGALTIANAQMTSPPSTAQGDTAGQMNNRAPQDNGSTAPNGTMNNTPAPTAPATTMDNAPVANDPTLPAQADRN